MALPLLPAKRSERRCDMKNLKILVLGGLLTGTLLVGAMPAMAGHKDGHPGLHKGWEKKHHGWKHKYSDDRYERDDWHDRYFPRRYGRRDRRHDWHRRRPDGYQHRHYGYREPDYRHGTYRGG